MILCEKIRSSCPICAVKNEIKKSLKQDQMNNDK